MKRRLMSALLSLGLVGGLFAGLATSGSADQHSDYEEWASAIFFASVHNGATVGETGPWHTNVTVQNVEESRVFVEFSSYVTGDVHRSTFVNAYASTTFPAADVLPDGSDSGPVVATAYWAPLSSQNAPCDETDVEASEIVVRGTGDADSFTADGEVVPGSIEVSGYDEVGDGGDDDFNPSIVGGNTINIDWSPDGSDASQPATGSAYEVTYEYSVFDCEREPMIGGYAKQSSESPMSPTSRTNAGHTSVDGYNAAPFSDVAWGPSTEFSNFGLSLLGLPVGVLNDFTWDGHSYLPIIQNNNGWESVINVSNIDGSDTADNASVTVRTFETAGAGQGGQADGSYQLNLGRGETRQISLSDLGVETDEYVGSVWIESDYGIATTIERYKTEDNMMIINEAAPSVLDFSIDGVPGEPPYGIGAGNIETYEAHAPLVFSGYHGWNSGFSIVNTAEIANTVNLEIRDESGNTVFTDQMTIDPKAQEFVYMPNSNDLSNGGPQFVGSALFSSALPFHASVDQVKYASGEAMSYIATQSGAVPDCNFIQAAPDPETGEVREDCYYIDDGYGDNGETVGYGYGDISPLSKLAFPLIQRGDGNGGDTSGLQLFNGSAVGNVHGRVWFFTGSGSAAPPTTSYGLGLPVNLGPRENATVYTLRLSGMDSNTTVSAIAGVDPILTKRSPGMATRGVLYGVTNNVNYRVDGDGAAAFNAVNAFGQFRTWSGPWFEMPSDTMR